jgi:2-C-methyl-D-erythritol 4-phosphate cytidylyltransferase/2-C-methyl-D-erythritol 2,4-cyclodiphosphate synthase
MGEESSASSGVPGTRSDTVAVVVAAGSSSRFGTDKLLAPLGGLTVLEQAVRSVREALPDAPTAVVVRAEALDELSARWRPLGVNVVEGGARRQDSVRRGFDALSPNDDAVVVIHDAARPFVPRADVEAVVEAARHHGAALLAAAVVDTVKRVGADGSVLETVPRDQLARALTPQAFRAGLLRMAWEAGDDRMWTDEAALVESLGQRVQAVPADPRNLKVTRPEDLSLLAGVFPREVRVGHGVDVHPFAVERPLWLCGVEIPGEPGLAGHSDADVALHAVTDAVLGASGAGDLGEHFPPSDERWRGAPSEIFLVHGVALARAGGWRIVSCDLTLMAEKPRISPHRARMRERLADLLGISAAGVNVKATTFEGLGFVGRGEGIVATAVVTVERQ